MEGFDLFHEELWHPFTYFGLTSEYLAISKETVIFTWVAIGFITIIALVARYFLHKPQSIGYSVVLEGMNMFIGMTQQAVQKFEERYCIFIAAIFIYIFCCNIIMIFPFCEEPTKNINTTIALALISFFYIQKESFKAHGFMAYIHEFIATPLSTKLNSYTIFAILLWIFKLFFNTIAAILSFPLELMSKFASVISLSFRLYGNIFGGWVIMTLWKKLLTIHYVVQVLCMVIGANLIMVFFFGLFEGFIQAFVFSTLSITYLGIGLGSEH